MKLIICSDIHGDLAGARYAIDAFRFEGADKLIILGDLLYHGPRNNLPEGYNPKAVITLLNEYRDSIIAVRGNCDAEVDQMVLDFPITSEFAELFCDGLDLILNHGHKIDIKNPPPINRGAVLLTGHTHVPKIEAFGRDNFNINPGSISLPKNNFPRTYALYENKKFIIKSVDGEIVYSIDLN